MSGAVVLHSGGMDSSLCLALAIREHGKENVISLGFRYGQRHEPELLRAKRICAKWSVSQQIADLTALKDLIPDNALTHSDQLIVRESKEPASTMVVGRNGLMAQVAGIYAHQLGYDSIYMGVLGLEGANSGYRDCSREYIDLKEAALRLDLANPRFHIETPLVHMTKKETMHLGYELGVLEYLLQETITCYQGIPEAGCGVCPACELRNEGIQEFMQEVPDFRLPYSLSSQK